MSFRNFSVDAPRHSTDQGHDTYATRGKQQSGAG